MTYCVHCGYCCRKAPCLMAELDENNECIFLIEIEGRYYCGLYNEQPKTEYPYFGAGCCSGLNSDRRQILQQHALETEQKDYEELIQSIYARADKIRQGNILSGMF